MCWKSCKNRGRRKRRRRRLAFCFLFAWMPAECWNQMETKALRKKTKSILHTCVSSCCKELDNKQTNKWKVQLQGKKFCLINTKQYLLLLCCNCKFQFSFWPPQREKASIQEASSSLKKKLNQSQRNFSLETKLLCVSKVACRLWKCEKLNWNKCLIDDADETAARRSWFLLLLLLLLLLVRCSVWIQIEAAISTNHECFVDISFPIRKISDKQCAPTTATRTKLQVLVGEERDVRKGSCALISYVE